jgi:hypothetical protein
MAVAVFLWRAIRNLAFPRAKDSRPPKWQDMFSGPVADTEVA